MVIVRLKSCLSMLPNHGLARAEAMVLEAQ